MNCISAKGTLRNSELQPDANAREKDKNEEETRRVILVRYKICDALTDKIVS